VTEIPLKIFLIKRQQPFALGGKRRDYDRTIFRLWKNKRPVERDAHGGKLYGGRDD